MKSHVILLAIGLIHGAALAAEPPAPPEGRFCDEHLVRCEEMRARHEAWCKQNPQTCKAGEERREARRRHCKQNPDECEAIMAEQREWMATRREHCRDNPVDCEDRFHDEQRSYREQRRHRHRCQTHPGECDRRNSEGAPRRSGPPR